MHTEGKTDYTEEEGRLLEFYHAKAQRRKGAEGRRVHGILNRARRAKAPLLITQRDTDIVIRRHS